MSGPAPLTSRVSVERPCESLLFRCERARGLGSARDRVPQLGGIGAIHDVQPAAGFIGNHIVVAGDGWVFDYHGYSARNAFLAHTLAKARRWWSGWRMTLVELPTKVLVSEPLSLTYDGLHLREPTQFLHDALPRAHAFLDRFPSLPPERRDRKAGAVETGTAR